MDTCPIRRQAEPAVTQPSWAFRPPDGSRCRWQLTLRCCDSVHLREHGSTPAESSTSASYRCRNQCTPVICFLEPLGFALFRYPIPPLRTVYPLKGTFHASTWWRWGDLNPRPAIVYFRICDLATTTTMYEPCYRVFHRFPVVLNGAYSPIPT